MKEGDVVPIQGTIILLSLAILMKQFPPPEAGCGGGLEDVCCVDVSVCGLGISCAACLSAFVCVSNRCVCMCVMCMSSGMFNM